jgi:gluconate 2-dehydrogenase gamma chain
VKRRDFLKAGSLAALSPGAPLARTDGAGGLPERSGQTFSQAQWAIIAAVQDHLLPSEPDAPGAREVNAIAYLDRTLADPRFDPDIKGLILKGIGWLEEIAQGQEGLPFPRIEPTRREKLLREIAATRAGRRWLSNLVTYCLEAMLADPRYGGNPGGIAWKWLEHDPGRPRPTPDKIYGRLGRA